MNGALRTGLFFGLWLILAGPDLAGLPFGLLAAVAAAWASLSLLPVAVQPRDPLAALRLIGRTSWQSLLAGAEIARRAFDPRLPLQPGLVSHSMTLPQGMARDGFTALVSLAPGALPAGTDQEGMLVVHVLDTRLPVQRDLAETEALLARAAGHG